MTENTIEHSAKQPSRLDNPKNTVDPLQSKKSPERLQGSIERVTFHNPDSGFCVLRIKVRGQRELITVVGQTATVTPGEYLECLGDWVNDLTYGLQFRANQLTIVPPNTLEGIERYLGSGMVKGIGPHFAKKLINAFGESVFDVIENEPHRLTDLPGIGPKRKDRVSSAWAEQKMVREIMVFLQSHGIGTARAVRIYKTYGDEAITLVNQNPYRLAIDIHGIGFKTADALAQRLGIPLDSVIRAQAGVNHVLQDAASHGHCAMPHEKLVEVSQQLLNITEQIVEQAIALALKEKRIIAERIYQQACIFPASLQHAEVSVTEHLYRLVHGQCRWANINPHQSIPWVQEKTGVMLSHSQQAAITLMLASKVGVITGGPGVGKTTIVNSLLQIIRTKNVHVMLCAPTGRAAKRLSESTGMSAKTIHRLLEFDPKAGGFKHSESNPLNTELVIIDEASMVDINLMNQLLKAIPDQAGVLIVGDMDQLPSVGPGAVLADLIQSKTLPTARLTEIFRQTEKSMIISNAHRINRGEMPLKTPLDNPPSDFYFVSADTPEAIHSKLIEIITQRIPKRFGLHPTQDIQVLTPMNRGSLGTKSLNIALQAQLNPSAQPRITRYGSSYAPGDKVIQTVNNYDKNVFNGDIGNIVSIHLEDSLVIIDYDNRQVEYDIDELDEVSLAYATTIHKSQGSEYPGVVIPLTTQHYTLLERNLLYTGVTRGKQLVVIVGQDKALAMAIHNHRSMQRLTKLRQRLREKLGCISTNSPSTD